MPSSSNRWRLPARRGATTAEESAGAPPGQNGFVSNAQFIESLAIAGEAGADYSGVICGRATWKDGIPVYARQGLKAFEEWLRRDGVRNITAVNAGIQSARPWYEKLGIPQPSRDR